MRRPTLLSLACTVGLVVLAVRAWRERVVIAPAPPPPALVRLPDPAPAPPPAAAPPERPVSALAATAPAAPPTLPQGILDSGPEPVPPHPGEPGAPPSEPPAPAKPVSLESAQLERLVAGPGVADMRMLNLTLRVDPAGPALEGADVRVHTRFYHQDALSQQVTPAGAAESEAILSGRLEPGATVTLTRPFVLAAPPAEETAAQGYSPRIFHGFRVEVYHRDRLVEKVARPASLGEEP